MMEQQATYDGNKTKSSSRDNIKSQGKASIQKMIFNAFTRVFLSNAFDGWLIGLTLQILSEDE